MKLRVVPVFLALLLVMGACGTGDTSVTTDAAPATAVTANMGGETTAEPATSETTSAATESTTSSPASTEAASVEPSGVDGPAAPDFSLALADGSTYQLSADSKPVYMVFWAEW